MPQLHVVSSPDPRVSGRTFEVQGELWIGRAPGNQIVVEDEGISRRHARVIPSGDTYVLIDENSANGVWLEERRVPTVILSPGVRARLGSTVVELVLGNERTTVYMEGGAPPPSSAAPGSSPAPLAAQPPVAHAPSAAAPPPAAAPAPSAAPPPATPVAAGGGMGPAGIGLSVLVALCLGAGGLWMWQERSGDETPKTAAADTKPPAPPNPAPAPAPAPSDAAPSDPVEGPSTDVESPSPDPSAEPHNEVEVVPAHGAMLRVVAPGEAIDGVEVLVPPGALEAPARIKVTAREEKLDLDEAGKERPELWAEMEGYAADLPASAGKRLHPIWGPVILATAEKTPLGPAIALEPDGLTFDQPVTVRIPLLDPASQDLDASNLLVIHRSGPRQDRWEVLRGVRVENGAIQVQIRHFSWLDTLKWVNRRAENVVKFPGRAAWMVASNRVGNDLATLPQNLTRDMAQTMVCEGVSWGHKRTSMPSPWETLKYLGWESQRPPSRGEKHLKSWLQDVFHRRRKGQKIEQVTVEQLFARALETNEGDVFGALLAAHNVLRDNRDLTSVQGAMAPFRKDGGDERGARYHLFGAAVYAYVRAYHEANQGVLPTWSTMQSDILDPRLTVTLEEGIVSGDIESDSKEYAVDLIGVDWGTKLYEEVSQLSRGQMVQKYGLDPNDCPRRREIGKPLSPKPERAPPKGGTKPPKPDPSKVKPTAPKREFGVWESKGYVFVGDKRSIEEAPSCKINGWGRDCKKNVKAAGGGLKKIGGPYPSHDAAKKAYCGMLDKDSVRSIPLTGGTKGKVKGRDLWVHNAPGC